MNLSVKYCILTKKYNLLNNRLLSLFFKEREYIIMKSKFLIIWANSGLTTKSNHVNAPYHFIHISEVLNYVKSELENDVDLLDLEAEQIQYHEVIQQIIKNEYKAIAFYIDVKKAILSIPIQERMKKEGDIKTKYPLRKAYESTLSPECISRPQTMAFTGSGIYDTIRSIGNDIPDEEFEYASKNILPFKSKFEYALFKLYRKNFKFEQDQQGKGCIHCGASMNGNHVSCKVCATLQVDGKELEFDEK